MRTILIFGIRWLIIAAAVWVAAELVPGIHLQGLKAIAVVALVLGLLNVFIKPVLVLVTFPITILTLGAFLLVINTVLLLVTQWAAKHLGGIQFTIDGFWPAFLGAIVISVVSFVLTHVLPL